MVAAIAILLLKTFLIREFKLTVLSLHTVLEVVLIFFFALKRFLFCPFSNMECLLFCAPYTVQK